ncbi:MAG: ribonuclease HI family protein [Candidatus Levybacteria bacterium]|nr:ribonuclease HI family protein [Candidatus Levybacteria bacterium]
MITINTDGGARGNPGRAAVGVYISDDKGKELLAMGKTIGFATNNVAEYRAVIEALEWVCEHKEQLEDTTIRFLLDSELVVMQLTGMYRVKNPVLQGLLFTIRTLESKMPFALTYKHIPRAQNKKADALVNKALDNLL